MTEKRRQQRFRTVRSAKIVFNDGQSVLDCRVRDISPTGARLLIETVVGVPDAFLLRLPERGQKACKIVWRGANDIGVVFED